jgi:hypothetical protein
MSVSLAFDSYSEGQDVFRHGHTAVPPIPDLIDIGPGQLAVQGRP